MNGAERNNGAALVFPVAFPAQGIGGTTIQVLGGLTKRELFAAMLFASGKCETSESAVDEADDLIEALEPDGFPGEGRFEPKII